MGAVDVVVVSYNSRDALRGCVAPLAADPRTNVIVVDNASPDHSLEVVADLDVQAIAMPGNGGFSSGCNAGWRAGRAPYVLFLNPDAAVDADDVARLAAVLDADPGTGAVAPRILDGGEGLDFTLRRFPRLRSTFARALFLHRVLPRAAWVDEVQRDRELYAAPHTAEWVVGCCMLVRRTALEALGGLDEGFVLYCEDKDLCARIWQHGWQVRFEPGATCRHVGGASAPRASLIPVLTRSRLRYASKHRSRPAAAMERAGLALEAVLRLVAGGGGRPARAGHLRSLRVLLLG